MAVSSGVELKLMGPVEQVLQAVRCPLKNGSPVGKTTRAWLRLNVNFDFGQPALGLVVIRCTRHLVRLRLITGFYSILTHFCQKAGKIRYCKGNSIRKPRG